MAGKIWREVHGEDFRSDGYEPFEDEDAALIVRAALFYIRTLAPPILDAFAACKRMGPKSSALFPARASRSPRPSR